MLKFRKYLYFILFTIALSSCLSKKDLTVGTSILENDLTVLNGTYKNIAANSREPQDDFSLYLLLFKNYHWQNPYYNKPEDYKGSIKLTAISNNKIKLERFVDGEIVKTKILKGKIYNNYFVTKRKWRIIGIPVLLGSYNESLMAISLTQNGYLKVRKAFEFTGGVAFLMANSNTYMKNAYFTKTESDGQEIYDQTMNLVNSLTIENPDNYIFYKTELYSIESYIWYDRNDSIFSYRITPDGIEKKVVKQLERPTPFNPNSTEFIIPPISDLENSNKSFIGYSKWIEDKIMKYGINVKDKWIPEAERTSQSNDFIRKVNEDLFIIQKEHNIRHSDLYSY